MTRYALPAILAVLLLAVGYLYADTVARVFAAFPLKRLQDLADPVLAVSAALNLLLLLALLSVLKWRKAVGNGLMALVPTELLAIVASLAKRVEASDKEADSAARRLLAAFDETRKHLPPIAHSIEILKKSLDDKDRELSALRNGARSDRHVLLAKKAVRLHQMMHALRASIERKQVSESAAMEFMAEELATVFEDLGIETVSPNAGQSLTALQAESITVKGTVSIQDKGLHNTVASVLEPGFGFRLPDKRLLMIRPAVVVVNSLGEANGDRRN